MSSGANKKKKRRAKTSSQDMKTQSSIQPSSGPQAMSTGASNSTMATKPLQSTTSSFEDELSWCLNQLQIGMSGPKPQKTSCEKNFKTLSSAKTPLPRKRQLMKSLFGDYRTKMKTIPLQDSPARPPGNKSDGKDLGSRFYRSAVGKPNASASTRNESFSFNFEITPDLTS